MARKLPAADRTISMFSAKTAVEEATEQAAQAEVVEENAKDGERVPLEQDVNRMRDNAFQGQEWTTKYFGKPEAPSNEYRVTRRGEYYYLETLSKMPGSATAYGYTGVMLHENDLIAATRVLVEAAREKVKRDAK